MLEIEIDGKKVEVPDGSTVMDAANKVGTYIPHFCYHKKLSIAANCRMCLVDVEKAPKPLPACATPVTNGMKVTTHSEKAVKAQKGVMEFLLINHPLDCPICDQGGECQLQDLAVGYGGNASRYQEEKRVVVNKNLGPLISTDMTRCIHCTRCVRFGQEIAGIMELGVANRGERSEIMAFVDRTVDSELSGNSIDLCPVGALTSKPFRFAARTWEMSRRRSVSPHDSLGSNLVVQVKHDRVMRVLPLENESINECWLSDKDRFSYEALSSDDRLTKPMVKQGGKWIEISWQDALDYAAKAVKGVVADHGVSAFGAFVSPHATLEEMFLTQRLVRGVGSDRVDFRLRQSDFSADGVRGGTPWLGMSIRDVADLDSVLVVGSALRKDHPLLTQRLRQAVKRGAAVSMLASAVDDPLLKLANAVKVAPREIVAALANVAAAIAQKKGTQLSAAVESFVDSSVHCDAVAVAESLCAGERRALFLGNAVSQNAVFGVIWAIADEISRLSGAKLGFFGEAANTVGGYYAHAFSQVHNTASMLSDPLKAAILVGIEPELDFADGALAKSALKSAETVIALTAFRSAVEEVADLMLPIAPFSETAGTFANCEGVVQSFNAVVKPLADARPGWKVLRVLGGMLDLDGFEYESSEAVRDEALRNTEPLSNALTGVPVANSIAVSGLQRVSDVPIYSTDVLVRRAPSLQRTRDASAPAARMSAETLAKLGLVAGDSVKVSSSSGSVVLNAQCDDAVADGCVRVAAGRSETVALGPMFGELTVERA
ncbi:NADH-quinone oxidoreductase subunit NuoG [Niveibacterium sp.]|uniref:NADH-quinone oxidoreductase subunit NuoG n=1 Tax=Niveibacterium sp. TaxID=2017444 RepID=UPI0035B32910